MDSKVDKECVAKCSLANKSGQNIKRKLIFYIFTRLKVSTIKVHVVWHLVKFRKRIKTVFLEYETQQLTDESALCLPNDRQLSQLQYLLALWAWASYAALCVSFLLQKMRII